ncbi:hypothetical protein [Paractinoplanes rishiriensis]|uniref:Fibronectin type-III domain-containing protein n=1 Tax=Paractinoplanes rishiriensis TaxID=1050105 RepID=A0A919JT26_9ACTN|nr:hypothetical protein [Actinoplanes rishiriensis]GIE93175.1 hypothetical protein Ari01nite_06400 [Actinoplanes rishiriensis]
MFAGAVGQPLPVHAAPGVLQTVPAQAAPNFRVTATGSGWADLAWDAPGDALNPQTYSVLVGGSVFGSCANITTRTCRVTGAVKSRVTVGVRAFGDAGEHVDSDPITTTLLPPPDAPGTPVATPAGSGSVTVTWTAPASWKLSVNRTYDVLVDGSLYGACTNIAATTCTYSGTPGVHAFVVRARGDEGLSTDSASANGTVVTAPDAPTDIHLTDSDAGSGTVAWTAPDFKGSVNQKYSVTVTVGGVTSPACTNISGTSCAVTADDIVADIVVTAIGDAGLSTSAAPVTLTLLPAPDTAANIRATGWGVGEATVSWDPVEFNGSTRNEYTVLADDEPVCSNITATSCLIEGDPDTSVSVKVRAVGDVGLTSESAGTPIALPDVPDPVTNIRVTSETATGVRVDWDPPAGWHRNIVQRYTVSAAGQAVCSAITLTYCVITGNKDSNVTVQVSAIGDDATLRTDEDLLNVDIPDVPVAPTGLTIVSTGNGTADLSWTATSDWKHNTNRQYVLTVNDTPFNCGDATLTTCSISGAGTVAVKVRAVGDHATLASAFTAPLSVPLIAIPTGAVDTVTVTPDHGQATVDVDWTLDNNALPNWNGGVEGYQVTVAAPGGVPVTGCDGLIEALTCSFTAPVGGEYTVTVRPANEAGVSATTPATDSADLVLDEPTTAVANLIATDDVPGTGVVTVNWDALTLGQWNEALVPGYRVTIDPPANESPTITNDTSCADPVAATTCTFTTDTAGLYKIHVVPVNEAGDGPEVTYDVFVAMDKPTATVSNIVISRGTGAGVVEVEWDGLQPADWNGVEHHYDVQIAPPNGAAITASTCDDLASTDATAIESCQFTTDLPGSYTVTITAVNEIDASDNSDDATQHITLLAPSDPVADLTLGITPPSGLVSVTWSKLTSAWNSAQTTNYVLTVTGPNGQAVGDPGTCTTIADASTAACSFTAPAAGNYTVAVVARSEAGDGPAATQTGHVTLAAPSGVVTGLVVGTTPDSRVVNLSWNQMTTGWSDGQTKSYAVTVTGGGALSPNTCTSVADTASPACSFTVTDPGHIAVSVKAVNEAGTAANGTPGEGDVVLVPTATVTTLAAAPASSGSSTVDVSWDQLATPGWLGGTSKKYRVVISGPANTVLSDNTCAPTDVTDTASPGCHFTATLSGAYTVRVNPVNEAGVSTATAASVVANIVLKPVATVQNLQVQAVTGNATIQVSWDPATTPDWNGTVTTTDYVVSIDKPAGATLGGTCTAVVAHPTATCSFTTDRGGDYTVRVALKNDVGTSDNETTSEPAHLTLTAPAGQVGTVTVTNTAGTGVVGLSWPKLADVGWSEGETLSYAVTIGGGLNLTANTCTSVPATDNPSCSFTTDQSGAYTVSVAPVNEAGTGSNASTGGGTIVFKPTGTVANLGAGTALNSPTVSVTWDQLLTGWQSGATKEYVVTVTPPAGGALANDGCTTGPVTDTASPTCSFGVTAGGDYVIGVAPKNEGGTGTAVANHTAHVVLRPTATVGAVTLTPTAGQATVGVSWPQLAAGDWNGGATKQYAVTIEGPNGATIGSGTCTNAVADSSTPGCSFTTDRPGAYTVKVATKNEAGTAIADTTGTGTLGSGTPAVATVIGGTGGVNTINATWTAAVATGLAAVTSYTVSAIADDYPTKTCTGTVTGTSCSIADVAAGVPYTVRVVTNGPGGSSAAADSDDPVVPTGTPVAPIEVPADAVPAGSGTGLPGVGIAITGSGYAPFSTVYLSLFSNPVSLGTTTADANGNISVTVTVPLGTPIGNHTLLATGLDANGEVQHLAKSVAVLSPPVVIPPPTMAPPTTAPPTTAPPTTPPTTTPPTTTPPTTTPPTTPPTAPPTTTAPPAAKLPTGAVTSLVARQVAAGTRGATVTWTPGRVAWGDGKNRSFEVTVSGPDDADITGSCTAAVAGTARSCSFSTDTNGSYAVRVVAATEAGSSTQSASASVTVNTAPGAPTAVTGTPAANSIAAGWKPPASIGAGVHGYTVTATAPYYPARSCTTVMRGGCTVTGLAGGVRYVLRVVAFGSGGTSPAGAATATVTPTGNVEIPQAVPMTAENNGSRTARPGTRITILGDGYRPGSRVLVSLYPGASPAGSTTASARGTVSATVTVPASGSHTVLTTGLDNAGRARYLAHSVRVGTAAASVLGVAGKPVAVQAVANTSSGTALAVTGTRTAPITLAGLFLFATGLLLVVVTGWRRGPRKG